MHPAPVPDKVARRAQRSFARGALTPVITITTSCAGPKASHQLRFYTRWSVFAAWAIRCWSEGPSRRFAACLSLDAWTFTPAVSVVHYPFLPTQLRPSRNGYTVGTLAFTRTTTSVRTVISGLQSFLYVQASRFACHPGRSYRCGLPPQGSCDFYFRAPYELLPPHTSDMLAVRFGQLTAGDFHPIRVRSVVGRIHPFKRFRILCV